MNSLNKARYFIVGSTCQNKNEHDAAAATFAPITIDTNITVVSLDEKYALYVQLSKIAVLLHKVKKEIMTIFQSSVAFVCDSSVYDSCFSIRYVKTSSINGC